MSPPTFDIQEQIKENLCWAKNWASAAQIRVITIWDFHEQYQGQLCTAVVTGILRRDGWGNMPEIYAISDPKSATEYALLDLLRKTEEMVAKKYKEVNFKGAEHQPVGIVDKLKQVVNAATSSPQSKAPQDKAPTIASPAQPGQSGPDEPAEPSGFYTPTGSVTSAASASTTKPLSDSYFPAYFSLTQETTPGGPINKTTSPTGANVRFANTREGNEQIVSVRIPDPEAMTKEEICALVREMTLEIFQKDGREIAGAEARKQVREMFGKISGNSGL